MKFVFHYYRSLGGTYQGLKFRYRFFAASSTF